MPLFLFALLLCLASISSARAERHHYAGIKLSYFELADSRVSDEDFDDPDNVGLQLGMEQTTSLGNFGAEAEFTRTFVEGTFEGHEVSVDTYGLFVLWRTRESLRGYRIGPYFKFKAGPFFYHVREEGAEAETEVSAAVGFGFGINMRVVRFELEILAPEKDIGFVSLNIVF